MTPGAVGAVGWPTATRVGSIRIALFQRARASCVGVLLLGRY